MLVAVPTFGSRIAPTFLHCETMQLARLAGGNVVAVEALVTEGLTEDERLKLLEDHKVSVLVCGGIGRELAEELEGRGIEVIHNVAGEIYEILVYLARGELRSGFGITYSPAKTGERGRVARTGGGTTTASALEPCEREARSIDCIACTHRVCLEGKSCPQPTGHTDHPTGAIGLKQTIEVTTDIAAEPERILCRISELIYFCLGMNYGHVGLAFCIDLFSEAEIVAQLLSRFVRVTPVCCRVSAATPQDDDLTDNETGSRCHPVEMVQVLNEAHTDLNVLIGLCMGGDVIFTQLSRAPVTTLFVKDRLLANNPIAACHSRYVLDHVLNQT